MELNPLINLNLFPEFHRVDPKHVVPGIQYILNNLEEELGKLETVAASNTFTWESLVNPLEHIISRLTLAWNILTHLKDVKDSEALRVAVDEVQPLKVSFLLKLGQSKAIYQAFRNIRDGPMFRKLNEAQQRVVEVRLKEAILSGVALEGESKARFNEIQQELEKLLNKFSENVLDSTKEYEKLVNDSSEIEGLPSTVIDLLTAAATSKGYKGANAENGPWLITLDDPIYTSVIKFAKKRPLREELHRANISVASQGKFDNLPIINRILELRLEKAQLLGYKNHVQVSMSQKMATFESCKQLLEEVRACAWDGAIKEMEELHEFAKKNGEECESLSHWDIPYWSERLREAKFNINEEELRPLFSLPKVMEGLFSLVKYLFGVEIEAADGTAPVWDEAVRFFMVKEYSTGETLGYFYFDPYVRPHEKRSGNWMGVVVNRSHVLQGDGSLALPVAHIVCNQTPPIGDQPSLMTFQEVESLFHEFGHALQHLVTKQDEGLVAGSEGIEWDAVELPSQFMENWCYHRKTLMGFAVHYKTGEQLSDDLYNKIKLSRTFRSASNVLRHVYFATLDLELHSSFKVCDEETVFDFCKKIAQRVLILPLLPEDRSLCSFLHLFATSEYAAGYYSYLWAEVLSADAFGAFEEAGLEMESDIKQTGKKFRETILELGGGRAPDKVYKDFRGRKPSIDALLRHRGLTK